MRSPTILLKIQGTHNNYAYEVKGGSVANSLIHPTVFYTIDMMSQLEFLVGWIKRSGSTFWYCDTVW